MNSQNAIGYIKCPGKDAETIEVQKQIISNYCFSQGYELLSIYEADGPCSPDQIERLEGFIGKLLEDACVELKLIPVSISQISRSLKELKTAFLMLHTKHIEIEPVDVSEQEVVACYYRASYPLLDILANLKAKENTEYTPLARCTVCGDVMLRSIGCSCKSVKINGKVYERVRYGNEEVEWEDDRCHDCGAEPGLLHHAGCDVEECPVCGNQLTSCDCDFEFVF